MPLPLPIRLMDGWSGDDDVGDDDDHDEDEDERCLWTDAVSEATGGHRANTLHFHHCSLSSPSIVYMFYVTSNLAIKDFLHLLPLRFQ